MPRKEPPTLAGLIQHWLGITRLEKQVAKATEQLTELKTAFADFSADVDAKLDQFLAAQGTLQPDAQTVFDDLKASVAAADARVGDADGSDTPVVTEPAPTEPVEPTPGEATDPANPNNV